MSRYRTLNLALGVPGVLTCNHCVSIMCNAKRSEAFSFKYFEQLSGHLLKEEVWEICYRHDVSDMKVVSIF